MCFECRILGALIHHNKKGVQYVVHKFSNLDFRPLPSEVKEHLIDVNSQSFLSGTLDLLKEKTGVELKVIKVDSDGSCLPYAVSRCLIGKEILYDILRQALHEELLLNERFYEKMFRQGMNDETWKLYWDNILSESIPTRGTRTGRWLGPGEHLVGMANVLARPILLLDGLENMKRFDGVSCGLFLPSRLSREEVLERNFGVAPSPIVIAWASEKKNHFVSLIRTSLSNEYERELFLAPSFLPIDVANAIERSCFKAEGKPISDERNSLRSMEMPIQVPISGPKEFVQLKDSETNEEIKIAVPKNVNPGETFQAKFFRPPSKLEHSWMKLLIENSATPRFRAISTLKLIIENLVDAFLANDFARIQKVSRLKLDNNLIKSNISNANGALDLLFSIGFELIEPQVIEIKPSGFNESLINVRDALRACAAMKIDKLRDIEGEVAAGKESELFGPRPACSLLNWDDAREMYGFDALDTVSKSWCTPLIRESTSFFLSP